MALSMPTATQPSAVAAPVAAAMEHGEADGRVYDASRNARSDVAAARERATASGRMTMIVLGGNWCHDSRALGAWLTSEPFQRDLTPRYEMVFVDVGHRDRNLDIPAMWGVDSLQGTPTVLIISADGRLLNRTSAGSWRNAASRKRSAVLRYLRRFDGEQS
jgi:hypothetical protein